jgi:DNA-directed RNA polymerase specialized sigma subunit
MAKDMLEAEYAEPYRAWKTKATPDTNAAMLKILHPVIEGAMRTHVGSTNPLLLSRARAMALQGLRTYDPSAGKLKTHLYNHLQGLRRVNRQQTTILHVPERVVLERQQLQAATEELSHQLGREPSDQELADHTGFSMRRMGHLRSYNPAVSEGTIAANTGDTGGFGGIQERQGIPGWHDIIYDELDPYHQKVMEYTLGMHGRQPLSNIELARKLNRSPGAVSQAKARIQQKLDEEFELQHMF